MNLRTLSATLLVVVASVLWMGAGTALATVLTSPEGTVYTGSIVAEAEGHVAFDNPIAKIECASKVEGEVESHGEGITVKGNVTALSFTSCTNSWHVTVVSGGSLEVHETEAGEGDGTVISNGATIEGTRFGVTCRYATESTEMGMLTGSKTTGSNATLDVEAEIPFHSGSGLCGTSAINWAGSYIVTTPSTLTVAKNFHFVVEEKTVEVTGTQESTQTFTFELGTISCNKFSAKRKWAADIKSVYILVAQLTYSECSFGGQSPTINTKKCEMSFLAVEIDKNGANEGKIIPLCPGNDTIDVETSNCKVKIISGEGYEPAKFKTIGAGASREVTAELNLKNLKYVEEGKGCAKPGATMTDGKWSGNVVFKVEKEGGGGQKGLYVQGT